MLFRVALTIMMMMNCNLTIFYNSTASCVTTLLKTEAMNSILVILTPHSLLIQIFFFWIFWKLATGNSESFGILAAVVTMLTISVKTRAWRYHQKDDFEKGTFGRWMDFDCLNNFFIWFVGWLVVWEKHFF